MKVFKREESKKLRGEREQEKWEDNMCWGKENSGEVTDGKYQRHRWISIGKTSQSRAEKEASERGSIQEKLKRKYRYAPLFKSLLYHHFSFLKELC